MLRLKKSDLSREELLLEIKRIHSKLSESSRSINGIYSALFSAMVFPMILEKMLFNNFTRDYLPHLLPVFRYTSTFNDRFNLMVNEIETSQNPLTCDVEKIVTKHFNKDVARALNDFYQATLSDERFKKSVKEILHQVCEQKRVSRLKNGDYEAIAKAFFSSELSDEPGAHVNQQVYNKINQFVLESCYETHEKVVQSRLIGKMLRNEIKGFISNFAQIEYKYVLNIPLILGVLAGKYLISDRLFQRMWNNGVEPLPRFIDLQSRSELLSIANDLVAVEKKIKSPVKRAESIAIFMALSLVMLYLLNQLVGMKMPQTVWLTTLCLTFSGVMNIAGRTKQYFSYERNYKTRLASSLEQYKSLFDMGCIESVDQRDLFNLQQSRIVVKCNNKDDLSGFQVARIIMRVLTTNNINSIEAKGSMIWLRPTNQLTKEKIAELKLKITKGLNEKREKHHLKTQQRLDPELWHEDTERNPAASSKKRSAKRIAPDQLQPAQVINDNNSVHPAVIEWKTATAKQTNQIINSAKGNQHTFFNLKADDFPNKKCFDKFHDIVCDNPKVVRAAGYQGLVFTKKYGGSLKAKVLGEYGDVRVYATQKEVSATGETLYAFDQVVLKAH